ncbi:MAG: DNA internalization-related competence protein ComEC/Rec2 [Dehalococcoidia bacterium]|nr:DNA internalization-related competence protein ComEC/Rec2 [Dehalococcoidia bacterium]
MPLLYISIAWLAGIFTGHLIALPLWVMASALLFFILSVFIKSRRRFLIGSGFCLLALLGGAVRYQSSIPPSDNTSLQFYNDKGTLQVEGMVSGSPETRKSSVVFRLSADSVTADNLSIAVSGNVLVNLPFYRQVRYGDVLRLTGKLETPPQFDDFDYRNYLYNQGICSLIYYPRAEILETDRGIKPLAWIYSLRARLADSLAASLPGPHGPLAQAILLGIRQNLPPSMVQSFYTTGTTHLIAISGLNLTIILGMLLPLMVRLLGRKNQVYIWLSLAFIWLYTILTGLPPTVVRATIMGTVFLAAQILGRQRNATAAISFAAALMVAIDPRTLWDASFQLSFLSMLGLIFISPYLIRLISPTADSSGASSFVRMLISIIVTTFGTTLAAIIATWPIIALNFHTFSLVGAPATFFAMPALPGIIVTSMLTAFAGAIWLPAGIFFGWTSWLFLNYFEIVVNLFSFIPGIYITNISIQPWQTAVYYIVLTGLFIMFKYKQELSGWFKQISGKITQAVSDIHLPEMKRLLLPALLLLAMANVLVWASFTALPDGKLHVSVLDVGQGESILIRTPQGQNILLDTGPDPAAACTSLGNKLPFWDRNIDMVILTQLQADHITGTFEILRRYHVNRVAVSPCNTGSSLSHEMDKAIETAGVNKITLCEGQEIDLGSDIRLAVLSPPSSLLNGTEDDINNNSIVLKLVWHEVSFLLTADIGIEAERYLIDKRADLQSDVLKIGHHGSSGSTCDEFLSIVNPAAAVISCGAVNRFGHPSYEVMDRLKERIGSGNIFVTATQGSVEFTTDGHRLWRRMDEPAGQ